jgi:HEPN domain-containing protein
MLNDTLLWVERAEGDFEGAQILSKRRSVKIIHLTCFASQQCAEKYLKAFLVERGVKFSKTHALVRELLPLCQKIDDDFIHIKEFLELLDPYAVEFRYPGESIPAKEARSAFLAVQKVRKFVRDKLGIEKQQRIL